MLRVPTPLDDETEEVIRRIIGCCIAVHRELGPGLLEGIYRRALYIEFRLAALSFEAEKRVPVRYRGQDLCYQRIDLVVEGRVLIEIKAIERLASIHRAQVISYLRVTNLRVALLINFNVGIVPDGLKRIVL